MKVILQTDSKRRFLRFFSHLENGSHSNLVSEVIPIFLQKFFKKCLSNFSLTPSFKLFFTDGLPIIILIPFKVFFSTA